MALSANRVGLRLRNIKTRGSVVIKTSVTLYHHGLTVINAAGKGIPAANATTTYFAGLCDIRYPDRATDGIVGDGTKEVDTIEECEAFLPIAAAVTVGIGVGAALYAVDDDTVTNATTLGPEIGTLASVPGSEVSGYAWVKLRAKGLSKAS